MLCLFSLFCNALLYMYIFFSWMLQSDVALVSIESDGYKSFSLLLKYEKPPLKLEIVVPNFFKAVLNIG